MYRVSSFVRRFAWALLGGTGVATLWVNLSPGSYYDFIEARLFDGPLPMLAAMEGVVLTPMTLISDGLMALFLFFVAKELWEALVLGRGALAGRQAVIPAGAVLGGTLGAILAWIGWAALFETAEEAGFATGWPVPVGSDIVLGYVIGRAVFGAAHPALHVLLLTTIATNIIGLLLAGVATPGQPLQLLWLLLPLAASVGVWLAFGRPSPDAPERVRRRSLALWPYVLAGIVSWIGVAAAGLPPALGLLPVIPAIPHADRAFGLFAEAEELLHDPLNQLSHLLVKPMALILFAFALTRGGIDLAAFAPTTLTVLVAMWVGKPLGVMLGALIAARLFGLTLRRGVQMRDLGLVALISGVGFTLPVLAIDTTLPGGAMAEAARLGAALSLLLWPVALVVGRLTARAKP